MEATRKSDAKVGLTVLTGLVILFLGIAWGKGCKIGGAAQTVKAVFPTAGGLEVNEPVTVNGLKRGVVTYVELRQEDVIVTMEFDQKVDLRRDARATIMMLELMGGKKVEILAGSSPDPLPAGSIIQGSYSGDVGSLVAMVTSLSESVKSITGKADTLLTSLNGMLEGDEMKQEIRTTLTRVQSTLSTIDVAARQVSLLASQNSEPLNQTLIEARTAARGMNEVLNENRAGLRGLVDSAGPALADTRVLLARTNRMMATFDTLLGGTRDKKSLAYRMMSDTAFAISLDSTLISIRKTLEQIRLQGLDANVRFFKSATPIP